MNGRGKSERRDKEEEQETWERMVEGRKQGGRKGLRPRQPKCDSLATSLSGFSRSETEAKERLLGYSLGAAK